MDYNKFVEYSYFEAVKIAANWASKIWSKSYSKDELPDPTLELKPEYQKCVREDALKELSRREQNRYYRASIRSSSGRTSEGELVENDCSVYTEQFPTPTKWEDI